MNHRIHLLPAYTANQIAAGEVIERPSSVIKELVENSIDAGADKIKITLADGGCQLIRVQDNGCGIDKEDLTLAMSRHATSKINDAKDLFCLTTLGFRGEALASIASVSHMTLTSKPAEQACAWQIRVNELAQPLEPTPASHPNGTTIEVKDLFYNTPARRHFLRSPRTEAQHCQEVVKRLALSNQQIAFQLLMEDKMLYQLPADAPRQRIQRVVGDNFLQNSSEIDLQAAGLRLWGWLGDAEFSRSQADSQYFFVNQRIVRDKLLNHAMRQVYQEVIYPGRYPQYVLYLECDPAEVDVNVHPTKHEVRFHQTRLIHDFITQKLTPIVLNQPQTCIDASTGAESEVISPPSLAATSPTTLAATSTATAPISYSPAAATSNHQRQASPGTQPFAPEGQSSSYAASSATTSVETVAAAAPTNPSTRAAFRQTTPQMLPRFTVAKRFAFFQINRQVFCVDALKLVQHCVVQTLKAGLTPQTLLVPYRLLAPKVNEALLQDYAISSLRLDEQTLLIKTWPKQLHYLPIEPVMQHLQQLSIEPAMLQAVNAIDFPNCSSDHWQLFFNVAKCNWQTLDANDALPDWLTLIDARQCQALFEA